MLNSHIIVSAGWILFCAFHSVFASPRFKQFAKHRLGSQYRYYRVYYILFAAIGFTAILTYVFVIDSFKVFTATKLTLLTGGILTAGGVMLMSTCIAKYFMQVSGIKDLLQNRMGNELMITGVHKVVRHPLYAGTFIFIWGLFILVPSLSLLISNTIITIYTLIGLRFEEQKLEKEFGEAYKTYKQKVPMIIPKFSR
jgi:protein-S-isoprenylcysteine O-methyltransferase Ste14